MAFQQGRRWFYVTPVFRVSRSALAPGSLCKKRPLTHRRLIAEPYSVVPKHSLHRSNMAPKRTQSPEGTRLLGSCRRDHQGLAFFLGAANLLLCLFPCFYLLKTRLDYR